MLFLITTLAGLYWWILSRYVYHWQHAAPDQNDGADLPEITVIIPYRNEALNLPGLIRSLDLQEYPHDRFSVILINDHSTDDGPEILKALSNPRLLLLNNDEKDFGKKSALEKGLAHVKSEWILFTDADTIRGPNWIRYMASRVHTRVDMIVGPVLVADSDSPYHDYYVHELTALTVVTAGALHGRLHALANGANMLIRRSALPKQDPFKKHVSPSGDDLFLSEWFFNKKALAFAKSGEAAVYTFAPIRLKDLIDQKVRWAGKFGALADWRSRLKLVLIGLIPIIIMVSTLLALLMDINYLIYAGIMIFVKWLADFRLISEGMSWQGKNTSLIKVLRHEFMNLIIYGLTTFRVLLGLKTKWKGRDLRSS